ncbi:hypothetical protein Tco_0252539 [Tanacetum coccineum]
MRNEDLCTKLEYFSEEYDKEREMEPRPARARETTPVLRAGSPRVRTKRKGGKVRRCSKQGWEHGRKEFRRWKAFGTKGRRQGHQPSTNTVGNLPTNGTYLSHNASPFISNSLQPSNGPMPIYVNPYSQPNMGIAYGQPLSYPSYAQGGLFADAIGCVTPFVRWIEDYPLPDGLKMPSHVGSYDRKGDPDNYLHLFEGAIRMQKCEMPVTCHMFTYTLKYFARIWWNGQKAGSILNYEDLKAKFWSHVSQYKKFTKTHLAVHNIKQKEGESTRAFVTRYTDDTLLILGLHEEQCIFGFVHGLKTGSLMEFLSTDLPTTY